MDYEYDVPTQDENSQNSQEITTRRSGAVGGNALRVMLAVLMLAGLGLMVTGFVLASNAPQDTPSPSMARVGSLAPDFELKDVSTGKMVRLSSLRGTPVWINFWATWCEPCRVEMPQVKKAYSAYRDKGVVVLGIDVQESPEDVLKYTKAGGFDWTFLIDADGVLLEKYQVNGIPAHWLVGRDGTLKAAALGSMPEETLQADIEKILAP